MPTARLHRSTMRLALVAAVATCVGCGEETPPVHAVHDLPVEALVETPWWMERTAEETASPSVTLERDPFDLPTQAGAGGAVVTRTTARHPIARRRLPSPPPVELQGIITWSGNIRAVIDGRQYKLGEAIKHRSRQWQVVEIDAEHRSVTLQWTDGEESVDATVYQRQDG